MTVILPLESPWPPPTGEERTILINFVLDKSGSMESIRHATISGFNEFKNDQARQEGRALMTLTLFDTAFRTIVTAEPIERVPDLDEDTYRPDGMTALYDAVGHTMRLTDEWVREHRPDQVLFVIMTDGEENSSREFSRSAIFDLIAQRQAEADYEFMYLGANQDSYRVGSSMGIRAGRMVDYDATPEVARATMRRVSTNVTAHRKYAEKQAPEMFSPEFEAMADLDGAALQAQKVAYCRTAAPKPRAEKQTAERASK